MYVRICVYVCMRMHVGNKRKLPCCRSRAGGGSPLTTSLFNMSKRNNNKTDFYKAFIFVVSICQRSRKPQLARNLHCHCSFKFSGAKVEFDYSTEKQKNRQAVESNDSLP